MTHVVPASRLFDVLHIAHLTANSLSMFGGATFRVYYEVSGTNTELLMSFIIGCLIDPSSKLYGLAEFCLPLQLKF